MGVGRSMNHYTKAFYEFLDHSQYQKSADTMFVVVYSAFQAGWLAAGGVLPKNTIHAAFPDWFPPSPEEKTEEENRNERRE